MIKLEVLLKVVIISPIKEENIKSPLPKDDLCTVWLSSGGGDFKNLQCIFVLRYKGRGPLFEQTWTPSPKDDLYQV